MISMMSMRGIAIRNVNSIEENPKRLEKNPATPKAIATLRKNPGNIIASIIIIRESIIPLGSGLIAGTKKFTSGSSGNLGCNIETAKIVFAHSMMNFKRSLLTYFDAKAVKTTNNAKIEITLKVSWSMSNSNN